MLTLATALLIGGALGIGKGLLNASVNSYARNEEYNETITELNQTAADLQTSKNNLTASYNLGVQNAKAEMADANSIIESNIANTALNQQRSLSQSASQFNLSDQIQSAQVAELQVQASQNMGQAVQAASMTGFRNTGSSTNAINATSDSSNRTLRNALNQLALSRMQTYQQAVNNYTSAEQSKAAYQMQIQNNKNALERSLAEYKLNYDQKINDYNTAIERNKEDINYMETTGNNLKGWTTASDYISSIFGGVSSGLTTGYNYFTYKQGV